MRKIVDATSEGEAAELRAIEIADAKRGAVNKAYGIKSKPRSIPFEEAVKLYLEWSRENKKSWETDIQRSQALKRAFKGKLMSDINPFMLEKYKMNRAKKVSKNTVNKELILGNQVFKKSVEWGKHNVKILF